MERTIKEMGLHWTMELFLHQCQFCRVKGQDGQYQLMFIASPDLFDGWMFHSDSLDIYICLDPTVKHPIKVEFARHCQPMDCVPYPEFPLSVDLGRFLKFTQKAYSKIPLDYQP